MHAPSAIVHTTYTYSRDVLLRVVEALVKLLHLDALLPMPIDQSMSTGEKEEPEQWTMTVESYVPPSSSRRPSTSQPEQELPVAHEARDEKDNEKREADATDTKPARVDKLGDVVTTEYPDYAHLPAIHEVHDTIPTTKPTQKENHTTSNADFVNPKQVDKLGNVIAIVHPERDHTSLITSPHLMHVLPDKGVAEETPEVCESKPGHLERTQSTHDVLADADEPTKSPIADELTESLSDAPSSLKLAKTEHSDDLDRVSTESNATDDTEDDRVRSLDKVYPTVDEHDTKRRRLEEMNALLNDINVPTPTSSRGDYKLASPSPTSSRGNYKLASPSPTSSRGNYKLASPSPTSSRGNYKLASPSPTSSRGNYKLASPSPTSSRGNYKLASPSPTSSRGNYKLVSPSPTSSRGDYKLTPPSSTSSRGGRSSAAVAKSKTLEWPASSSSEEDDENFLLEERFTSPRFMPTMGQATYFSTGM